VQPWPRYRLYGFGEGWPATPLAAPSLTELGSRETPPTTCPAWFAPWFALSIWDAQPQTNSSPAAAIVDSKILIMVVLLRLLRPDDVAGLDAFQ
jgi:hypothetical protein